MQTTLYLKIKAKQRYEGGAWHPGAPAVSKNKPSTAANEIAIRLDLDIPDTLFEKPQLQAKIVIPKDSVTPPELSAEVQDNIAAILTEQVGLKVHVGYDKPEEVHSNG